MAYGTYVAFAQDFIQTWGSESDVQGRTAFGVYVHGLKQGPGDGLTIGLIPILEKVHIPALGSVFDGGQIFVDTTKKNRWRIFLNDCFILGGIHSHGDFRLVGVNEVLTGTDDPWKSMVEDPGNQPQLDYVKDPQAKYNLKVTQREVIGLNTFGYSGGPVVNGVRTFTCTQPDAADAASLSSYREAVTQMEEALRAG